MKMPAEPNNPADLPKPELLSELLIMPDGKVYAHNLTPEMAAVLSELNPEDENIKRRVITRVGPETKKLLPHNWGETPQKP
jgi:hypothetical protein